MKKLISHSGFILLASLLLILLLMPPTQAQAAEITASGTCGAEGDNLTWTLDTEGTLTISGTGEMADYDCVNSALRPPWFPNRLSVDTIIIGHGVSTIGICAFSDFDALTLISIPNSVTSIGSDSFYNCDSLTSVTIPDSVTQIGMHVFSNCDSLIGIWVDKNNTTYSSDSHGVLFNKDRSILHLAPGAIGPEYAVPKTVNTIDSYAFSYCNSLVSVFIPESVTDFGWNTFDSCTNLTSVDIQGRISYIHGFAFFGCTNLTSITIPDSVEGIVCWAFADCKNLTSIIIPDNVAFIDYCSFSGCSGLTSIVLPKSVTHITGSAFYGCDALKKVLYKGTPEEWEKIEIGYDNDPLLNATIYYGYFPGDADDDGEISDWDAIVLNRYLAGWIVEINLSALDIDGDGEVTDWDGIVLERYLAGWDISING